MMTLTTSRGSRERLGFLCKAQIWIQWWIWILFLFFRHFNLSVLIICKVPFGTSSTLDLFLSDVKYPSAPYRVQYSSLVSLLRGVNTELNQLLWTF